MHTIRNLAGLLLASMAALLTAAATARHAEKSADSLDVGDPPVLSLRTRIPLPGVYGRIDHYGWDGKRANLIVSALGNDTVEIVNSWKRVHTIAGLEHPQASVYLPGADRIVVSSQSGKLRFYDAESHSLVRTLDFGANANTDNMRYDAVAKRLYVGYGGGSRAALAVVDAAAMERVQEFKVGSHPESFQLESEGPRIFVNLPDQESIGVVDRNTGVVTKWKIPGYTNVHALALDEASHRLFAASLQPGRLMVVDTQSGRVVATLPAILGVDDIWFDAMRKRIYAPGTGAIDVFQQVDPDTYKAVARVRVGAGAGSTSFHLKTRTQDSLFMSWPNMLAQGGSEVLLFYVND
jgi:DNA-binding beta-propeller fold protein YncE